jgi:hypothetical protein
LSNMLWFDLVIHGWSNIYKDTSEQDITWYAHSLWIPSIVIECWQHNDPDATQVAYKSILRFMWFHGIIDYPHDTISSIKHIKLQRLYKMKKTWKFVKERTNWDFVSLWEVIAEYEDWEKVFSDYTWYIILPKTFANIGDERFYIGTQE